MDDAPDMPDRSDYEDEIDGDVTTTAQALWEDDLDGWAAEVQAVLADTAGSCPI